MTNINIRNIPEDLKKAFKIYCVRNNMSMTEAFIKYMEKVTKNDNK